MVLMSTTNFDIFKRLLTEAVSADEDLSATQIAEINARVAALTETELLELGSFNATGTIVDVTRSEETDSLTVLDGKAGSVIFALHSFDTPVRVLGVYGVTGALIGTVGGGANDPVAEADITIQYRLASSGDFRSFNRNVVLTGVEQIQFKVIVATQTLDHDVPKLWIVCEQE